MFTKEMFDSMKKYNEFTYWFTPCGLDSFEICRKYDNVSMGLVNGISDDINVYDDSDIITIEEDWKAYKNCRPEFDVGISHSIDAMSLEEASMLYEKLIIGCAFIRGLKNDVNPDTCFSKISTCLEWLRKGDFYTAPASTIYHESEPSGLLHHTLKVVNKIQELKYIKTFKLVDMQDAVLVALVHDWCKIGLYEMYMRNQKNEKTGQWEKVAAYKRKNSILPMGHGAASMWQASKCFRLSTEEALAIRWHQGRWNVCDAEMDEFQHANETYPLVHMLQFADQLAITDY